MSMKAAFYASAMPVKEGEQPLLLLPSAVHEGSVWSLTGAAYLRNCRTYCDSLTSPWVATLTRKAWQPICSTWVSCQELHRYL